jgi:hypothetical protein
MKLGLLWYDADTRLSPQDRLAEAAARFAEKFRRPPNCCHVHPAELFVDPVITVVADPTILKHHFWVGRDEAYEPVRRRRGSKQPVPSEPRQDGARTVTELPPPSLPSASVAVAEPPAVAAKAAPRPPVAAPAEVTGEPTINHDGSRPVGTPRRRRSAGNPALALDPAPVVDVAPIAESAPPPPRRAARPSRGRTGAVSVSKTTPEATPAPGVPSRAARRRKVVPAGGVAAATPPVEHLAGPSGEPRQQRRPADRRHRSGREPVRSRLLPRRCRHRSQRRSVPPPWPIRRRRTGDEAQRARTCPQRSPRPRSPGVLRSLRRARPPRRTRPAVLRSRQSTRTPSPRRLRHREGRRSHDGPGPRRQKQLRPCLRLAGRPGIRARRSPLPAQRR